MLGKNLHQSVNPFRQVQTWWFWKQISGLIVFCSSGLRPGHTAPTMHGKYTQIFVLKSWLGRVIIFISWCPVSVAGVGTATPAVLSEEMRGQVIATFGHLSYRQITLNRVASTLKGTDLGTWIVLVSTYCLRISTCFKKVFLDLHMDKLY